MNPAQELKLREELAAKPAPMRELEIRESLQGLGGTDVSGIETKPVEQETTFGQRVSERLGERFNEIDQIGEDWKSKKISTPGAVVDYIGKGVAGPILDVAGEAISTAAGKAVDFVFDEDTQDQMKSYMSETYNNIINSDIGKQGLAAIEQGMDAYEGWKKENPEWARHLESVVNIGMVFAPAKAKKNASPTPIGKTGDWINSKAVAQAHKQKKEYVDELIRPPLTKKNRMDNVKRSTETGKGPFKRTVYELSDTEKAIANEVSKIEGVGNKETVLGNYNLIKAKNNKVADALERNLSKHSVDIDRNVVAQRIEDKIDDLIKNNIAVASSERTMGNTLDIIKRTLTKFLGEEESTPLGVLRARRRFDAWLIDNRKNIFKGDTNSALKETGLQLRRELNDIVSEYAPQVGVKKSLEVQTNLFRALDNINPKAADMMDIAIARAFQNATKLAVSRNKLIQEAAVLMGTTSLGAATVLSPWMGAGLAATGAVYGGYRFAVSPKTKAFVGTLIKGLDDAITQSGNAKMRHQLRADRATLVELLKNAEVREDIEEQQ